MDKNELSKIKQKALIKTLIPVITVVGLLIAITFLSIFLTDVVELSAGELGCFYIFSVFMIILTKSSYERSLPLL